MNPILPMLLLYDIETGRYVLLPDYIGCRKLGSTTISESFTEITWNSITQCTQLCLATGSKYAATGYDTCHCFDDASSLFLSVGDCDDVCTGNSVQACGTRYSGTSFAYNVVNISMLPP